MESYGNQFHLNKTYKLVSEIVRQNFPEETRGFSEKKNVRLVCAMGYGIRRLNEYEVDFIVQDCVNEASFFFAFFVSVISVSHLTYIHTYMNFISTRISE